MKKRYISKKDQAKSILIPDAVIGKVIDEFGLNFNDEMKSYLEKSMQVEIKSLYYSLPDLGWRVVPK